MSNNSQGFYGSINFDALVKAIKTGKIKTVVGDKGTRYVNFSLWINEQPDQFDSFGAISLNHKKEHQDEKRVYIANLYKSIPKEVNASEVEVETDDLPF